MKTCFSVFFAILFLFSQDIFGADYLLSNNNKGNLYNQMHLPETVGVSYIYDTSKGGLDFFTTGDDEQDTGDNNTREPDLIDGSGTSGTDALWGPWNGNKRIDVVFDLGQKLKLTKFNLHSMGTVGLRGVSSFTIYISDTSGSISTAENWQLIGTNSAITYANSENTITAPVNTYGRYVWFSIIGADKQLQLSELAILGNLGPIPDCGSIPESSNHIFGVASHMNHTDIYGLNFNTPYWRPENTLPLITEGNFQWVREPLYMRGFFDNNNNIDPRRSELVERYLQMYQNAGVSVVLDPFLSYTIDDKFQTYIEYIAQLSKTYSCIKAIELHNEPNLMGFWTAGVNQYVNVCSAAYGYIKAINPDIEVVAGSFSGWGYVWGNDSELALCGWSHGKQYPDPSVDWELLNTKWLQDSLSAGLLDCCDSLSFHPYRDKFPPEGGIQWEAGNDPCGFEKEMDKVWNMIQTHNNSRAVPKSIKLYFTEFGFSSDTIDYRGLKTTQKQADYLSRSMLMILHKLLDGIPIKMVSWYDLKCDDPSDADDSSFEANLGLVSNNAQLKRTAYHYYSRITNFFNNTDEFKIVDMPVSFSSSADKIKHFVWRKTSGEYIIPFWRLNQLQNTDADFDSTLTLNNFDEVVESIELCSCSSLNPTSKSYSISNNNLSVPLSVKRYAQWLVIKVKPNILSGNALGYVLPATLKKLNNGATYSWINEKSGAVFGATDSSIISTDDGNDLIDGLAEAAGGDFAVHGTWNGTDSQIVATCEFDLKKDCMLKEVLLSFRCDTDRKISAQKVYTSLDKNSWDLWAEWDGVEPAHSRDARIFINGPLLQTRFVRVFTQKGANQQIIGEVALLGYPAPTKLLLSDNQLGHVLSNDTPTIKTHASYSWINTNGNAAPGATDAQIISTDQSKDMTDGYAESAGGNYAVHGTWDGSGVNSVATCEFDLKSEYYITEVMLSLLWENDRKISLLKIFLQKADGSWQEWASWNGVAPSPSRDARIYLRGIPAKTRKVRIFTTRGAHQQVLGEIAIFGQQLK